MLREAMRELHAGGWFPTIRDRAEEDAEAAARAVINTFYLRTTQMRNKASVADEVAELLTFSISGGAFLKGVIEEGHPESACPASDRGTTYFVRLISHGCLAEDFGRVFAVGTRSGRTWTEWL
jgi:hypothetical protein